MAVETQAKIEKKTMKVGDNFDLKFGDEVLDTYFFKQERGIDFVTVTILRRGV